MEGDVRVIGSISRAFGSEEIQRVGEKEATLCELPRERKGQRFRPKRGETGTIASGIASFAREANRQEQ